MAVWAQQAIQRCEEDVLKSRARERVSDHERSQVIVCICSYSSCTTHNNKLNIGVNGRRREKDVHWIRAYVMLAIEVCTKSRRWEKMASLLHNAWHCFCKLMILTFNGSINLIMCLLIYWSRKIAHASLMAGVVYDLQLFCPCSSKSITLFASSSVNPHSVWVNTKLLTSWLLSTGADSHRFVRYLLRARVCCWLVSLACIVRREPNKVYCVLRSPVCCWLVLCARTCCWSVLW